MNTYSLSASPSMVRNIQINRHKSNSYHYVIQQKTKKRNTFVRWNKQYLLYRFTGHNNKTKRYDIQVYYRQITTKHTFY